MNVIDREELTIILVDDHLKTMNPQIDEIKQYLKDKKLKMNLLQDDSGEQVEALLDKYPVDIVFTDKKMENNRKKRRKWDFFWGERNYWEGGGE